MAEIKNYGSTRLSPGMKPLGELLPLDTPLSLLVDPTNGCNFKCVFCPTGFPDLLKSVGRETAVMRPETFRRLIDGLEGFRDPIKVLHLYKDGEPLINKWLGEIIRIARESGRVSRIETTSNGALMTAERAAELIDAGIDGIRISVYGLDDESYKTNTRGTAGFDAVVRNVATLFAVKSEKRPSVHVHCKIIDTGLSDADKARFVDTFSPISDSVHIDSLQGWSDTGERDMTLGRNPGTGMGGAPLRLQRKACSEPFMRLAVNANGDVSVCCVDWAHETKVGNVNEQTIYEIWRGERLREFRLKHLTGQRHTIKACASCQYVLGLPPNTDFDDRLAELIPKYAGADSNA